MHDSSTACRIGTVISLERMHSGSETPVLIRQPHQSFEDAVMLTFVPSLSILHLRNFVQRCERYGDGRRLCLQHDKVVCLSDAKNVNTRDVCALKTKF